METEKDIGLTPGREITLHIAPGDVMPLTE